MKLSDEKLTGWLVMMHHQYNSGGVAACPREVTAQLVERGWMQRRSVYIAILGREIEGLELTEAGRARVDMDAAEWGCDALEYVKGS